MKNLMFILLVIFFFASCEKEVIVYVEKDKYTKNDSTVIIYNNSYPDNYKYTFFNYLDTAHVPKWIQKYTNINDFPRKLSTHTLFNITIYDSDFKAVYGHVFSTENLDTLFIYLN